MNDMTERTPTETQDSTPAEWAPRIERGMALLDALNPGWERRVNLPTLDMNYCFGCVFGQLYGVFSECTLTQVGLKRNTYRSDGSVVEYGFDLPFGSALAAYAPFTDAWREAIRRRLAVVVEAAR